MRTKITNLAVGKVYTIKSWNRLYKYGDRVSDEQVLVGYLNTKIILLELLTPKNKLLNNNGSFYRMKIFVVDSGIVGWIWNLSEYYNQELKQLTP